MSSADVGAGARRFDRGALRREIDRTAAVGVRDDGGNALRDERLPLVQRRVAEPSPACEWTSMKPGATMRSRASMSRAAVAPAERADGGDAVAGDAEVGAQPGIARAIHDAGVANQNIEPRRLRRLEP